MAISTVIGVPAVVEAGNNYNFQETFTDFPASAWSMQFVMSLDGSNVAPNVTNATNSGNTFNVSFGTPTTAGRYLFAEYVTETASSQRTTAKTGVLQVIPNLTQTQPLSTAATLLAAAEAGLAALASGAFSSVSVNNVSYTYQNQSELIALRTRLQAEVIRERQARDAFRGIETSGRIGTRFKS